MLPRIRIPELYLINIENVVAEFQQLARQRVPSLTSVGQPDSSQLKLKHDPQFRRLHATVDMELALKIFNVFRYVNNLLCL